MTESERGYLKALSYRMGSELTEEQMEFASDFTKSVISFSDPGTGKTHSLVAGMVMAQEYHGIRGSKINCMSFTNAAVAEIKGRYDVLCRRSRINASADFNTFHSLASAVKKEAFPTMRIQDKVDLYSEIKIFRDYVKQAGIECEDYGYAKKIYYALNTLNAALVFEPRHLRTKYEFVQLDVGVEEFQKLRLMWFNRGVINSTITQGDIPLYCLYALRNKKELAPRWKNKYKVMIVDEFQDLSLLHLNILSYITEHLIVIGDMKQQIYQFSGACPQIVDEYLRTYKDAKICNLTKSFRCSQEIAEFATKVIKPNDAKVECFEGTKVPGSVEFVEQRNINWKDLATEIYTDVKMHTWAGAKNIMFLYRNNASAIPIMEQLYKLKIPFRCSRFTTVMQTPIFKDLCTLANAAWQPSNVEFVTEALRLFPEFKGLTFGSDLYPVEAMKQTGKSLFEIQTSWREESSVAIMNALMIAAKKIKEEKSAGVVLNNLLGVYEKYIIKGQWWRFDREKDFYFSLVAPICNAKQYPTMYYEEIDKEAKNRKAIQANTGVRCYTMHSAKGLEADIVYILDCDEGVFPSAGTIKRKLDAHCYYDAACEIRSERNLLYVALTRAKEKVVISYSDQPAFLISEPNSAKYSDFDEVYNKENAVYDDAEEFCKLFRLGRYAVNAT